MCTLEKRGNVFVLTLTGEGGEHRLNPSLVTSIRSALSEVRSQAATGPHALVTTAEGKFFSNGLDLAWAAAQSPVGTDAGIRDGFLQLVECLKPLLADLLTLPMPTIAAVNGHTAAAGFVLAICHDYVVMRKDKGVVYMSEVDVGVTFPEFVVAVIGEKVGAAASRDLVLGGRKVGAEEAVGMGLVDSAHVGVGETVEAGVRIGEELAGRGWRGKRYGEIRRSLFPETWKHLGLALNAKVSPRL